jgi:hypothetical protein
MNDRPDRVEEPPMSDEAQNALGIYRRLKTDRSYNLSHARMDYREKFGVGHDDEIIDRQYLRIVERHFGYPRPLSRCLETVPIPVHVALAFSLRELAGRKKETPLDLVLGEREQMAHAQEIKVRLMNDEGLNAGEAKIKAAQLSYDTFIWRDERKTLLTVKEIIERFNHPGRYNLEFSPR